MSKEHRKPCMHWEISNREIGIIRRINLFKGVLFWDALKFKHINGKMMTTDCIIGEIICKKYRLQEAVRVAGSPQWRIKWITDNGKYSFYTIPEAKKYFEKIMKM